MIDWKEVSDTATKWELDKQDRVREILDKLDFKNVYEVGCGNGEFSKILLEFSNDVKGIDMSSDRLKRNPIKRSTCGDFMLEQVDEMYDLVCCSHVLLHISPDYVDRFYNKMKSLGLKYLIIIEPDITRYKSLTWEYGNYPYNYDMFDNFKKYDIDEKVSLWLMQY